MAWVSTKECMTSDNLPLCGFVPYLKESTKTSFICTNKLRVSDMNLPKFAQVVSQWLPLLTRLSSIEETEHFAQELCRALENALKAVGKRPNKKSGTSAPWWTLECKSAHIDYRRAVDEPDRLTQARTFRATVASANREHWTRKIEDMKSSQDVFSLIRWAAPQNTNTIPPLRHEGKFIFDHAERALVFEIVF